MLKSLSVQSSPPKKIHLLNFQSPFGQTLKWMAPRWLWVTQDTHKAHLWALPVPMPCAVISALIGFAVNGMWLCPAPCWAPRPGSGPGLGTKGPALPVPASYGSSAFPLAGKNELLLLDFWLAFSRHLARSWAGCHSSNGAAYDPDKGLLCWWIILPFPFALGIWQICLCFLKNIWSIIPVWEPWCMGMLRYEGVVRQRDKSQ